mmetsp:Transcript_1790/g.3968  ORF Transcript_1790/g.3968 Transcript_1790/m.3968 type:complete len:261 (-) Transcript_1790:260-1042(-)
MPARRGVQRLRHAPRAPLRPAVQDARRRRRDLRAVLLGRAVAPRHVGGEAGRDCRGRGGGRDGDRSVGHAQVWRRNRRDVDETAGRLQGVVARRRRREPPPGQAPLRKPLQPRRRFQPGHRVSAAAGLGRDSARQSAGGVRGVGVHAEPQQGRAPGLQRQDRRAREADRMLARRERATQVQTLQRRRIPAALSQLRPQQGRRHHRGMHASGTCRRCQRGRDAGRHAGDVDARRQNNGRGPARSGGLRGCCADADARGRDH